MSRPPSRSVTRSRSSRLRSCSGRKTTRWSARARRSSSSCAVSETSVKSMPVTVAPSAPATGSTRSAVGRAVVTSPIRYSGQAEELGPVPPEESLAGRLVETCHGVTEGLEGPLPPFGVRVVRREHEEVRAALLEQPCGVLEGERREAHLAAEVLRGQKGQFLQRGLELGERAQGVVDVAQQARHPGRTELDGRAAQSRVALEDPVQRHAG